MPLSVKKISEWGPLYGATTSAQRAKLIALIRALKLGEGLRIDIYTDSAYVFHVVHVHASIWEERGLLITPQLNTGQTF